MSCEELHRKRDTRFCPICGTQLFDTSMELMNDKLLIDLEAVHNGSDRMRYYSWFNCPGANLFVDCIWKFMFKYKINIPEMIFFDRETKKFILPQHYFEKYPMYEIYNRKRENSECFTPIHGMTWLFLAPTFADNFANIDKIEKEYDIPMPDRIYNAGTIYDINTIKQIMDKYGKNPSHKEYFLSIIKRM